MKPYLAVTAILVAAGWVTLNTAVAADGDRISVKPPFGLSKPTNNTAPPQILYHNGPVMLGNPVALYVIYYGNVGDFPNTSQPIINAFLAGLGGTPQFDVNTSYCNDSTTNCPGTGTSITGKLSFTTANIFYDAGSQGKNLSTSSIPKVIQHALTTPGGLPTTSNAIYMLVTAPTVKVSGFCTSYCAFHTSSTTIVSGTTIRYAVAPEPGTKCTVCDGNFSTYHETATPNGDPGADEIVDSLMHEISETVTDPDISAWFTQSGAENGDLCNFTYGTPLGKSPTTGATYNATWGNYFYLIQLIWENRALPQGCAAAPSK